MTTHNLDAIRAACLDLLDDSYEETPLSVRQAAYCSIVDPTSVLTLVRFFENNGQTVTPEEWKAIGQLIRDMAGYMRMTAGEKPDLIREDLLLRATQLLDITGL